MGWNKTLSTKAIDKVENKNKRKTKEGTETVTGQAAGN